MNIIYTYLLTLPVLVLGDYLFLGVIAKNSIASWLEPAIGQVELKIVPALVFYLLYMLGLLIFAIYPGATQENITKSILLGALLGFMCYMTYELTNASTIKNWPITLIFVDIAWGTFVSAITAGAGYYIYNLFK